MPVFHGNKNMISLNVCHLGGTLAGRSTQKYTQGDIEAGIQKFPLVSSPRCVL